MLTKVPSVNFEKCYPSRLKGFFKKDFNYRTYNDFVPNSKGQFVGNLPHEIIDLFKGKDKVKKIKCFQSALANASKYIRECYKQCKKGGLINTSLEDLAPENLKIINQELSSYLNGMLNGVVPKGVKAKLAYTGRGYWGNVFKFSMSDKNGKIMHDKAIKVFHNIQCADKSLSANQGVYAEANFWTFLKNIIGHKMDKTQFTRHYISDLKSAYSMTEFADKNVAKTTTPIDFEKLFKIFYTDYSNEKINEKIYDIGGCIKFPGFINDKVILKFFKKLMHRNSEKDLQPLLNDLQAKAQNPKTPHRNKIQKALELFEKRNEPLY